MCNEKKDISKATPQEHAVAQWIYHSQMMWSRIQTVSVIEAGVLVGWYQAKGELGEPVFIRCAILVLGCLLLQAVGLLMRRDANYIEASFNVANPLTSGGSASGLIATPETQGYWELPKKEFGKWIRALIFGHARQRGVEFKGRQMAIYIPIALVLANILLLFYTIIYYFVAALR